MQERRPDPDALLAEVQNADGAEPASAGRLKVFLGATAGVGKTYAMLEAAHERARAGWDVVIGVVETHGRKETAALVRGLEVLPPRRVEHRGVALEELDIDAALARRPRLILIDELAHTNAPGSRHAKRWQDVEELLRTGIDVFGTLNVQHLESLNDVVARVTHVRVRETVPDRLVEGADAVELIDLPPDELLRRLGEGKVYVPEQAARATQHFFKRGNLIALRQLALRYTASHVDEGMLGYRRAHAVGDTWPVGERLLVGVGPAPSSRSVVRATKRIAAQLGAEWHAVFVETPAYARWSEADRQRVWETLRLARELGAETATVAGSGTGALLDYARRENVGKIVVGKPARSSLRDRWGGPGVLDVIRASGDVDVYVISGDADEGASPPRTLPTHPRERMELAIALAAVAACTGVGVVLRERTELANVVMLYLTNIVALAGLLGRRAAVVASVVSVAAFDFFIVPPYGTFAVRDARYVPVFLVMLVVSLVVSTLTARLRAEASASRLREARTAALLGVTRDLVPLQEPVAIAATVERQLSAIFGGRLRLFAPDPFGRLRSLDPTAELDARSPAVAEWVRENLKPAGTGTATLPDTGALYVPVSAGESALGVLEIAEHVAPRFRDPEQMQLLETFARLVGTALERARLAAESRRAEQLGEVHRLKSRFVAVAAKELGAPLDGLSRTLGRLAQTRQQAAELDGRIPRRSADDAPDLIGSALADVERLRHLSGELLDLSKLEAGALELRLEAESPAKLVEREVAAAAARARGSGLLLLSDLPSDLPLVRADPEQISRVLRNLIENALQHARERVVVGADTLADVVELTVADDGPGVPLQQQERVFEAFAGEGQGGGASMGLAIARGIVLAHGGEIWVDSGPGPGAVFTFTLGRADRADDGPSPESL